MSQPESEPATNPGALHRAPSVWRLRLLGAVEAGREGNTLLRWPSRAVAALLARLALAPQRAHPREELVELLWPGVALDVGRNRLRHVLSVLKGLLEQAGPVIDADRSTIRLVPGALVCDAVEFERLVRGGAWSAARDTYLGDLMPGYYEEWVLELRARLATLFERVEAQTAGGVLPPWPLAVQASPLPGSWTRLFGIEHNATRLLALVRNERLVSLVGSGGAGKTRLAIEVARALRDAPDWTPQGTVDNARFMRIVFVSLVDCFDERQAVDAIARTLNITARDPLHQVRAVLAGQTALLVLDNFEQLAASAQTLLVQLLEALPVLHLLLTSRQRLGLPGEQVLVLGGLPLPDSGLRLAAAVLNPAVGLFVDRAQAARADFKPAARELPAICALVRLLDGMPLALELAASQLRNSTPQELLQRLQTDAGSPLLDVLDRGGGTAAAPGRHTSLRAVMRWSWRQLGSSQAGLLQAMTVLTAPARAETVAAAAGMELQPTQALLQDLVDASLVQAREDAQGVTRHGLLQPVREFAAETLSLPRAAQARSRVRRWLIERGAALLRSGPDGLESELGHVHAGITGALADHAAFEAVQIALALKPHWSVASLESMPVAVMRALDTAANDLTDGAQRSELAELLAQVHGLAGFVPEALAHAEQALLLAADARQHSLARSRLVWVHLLAGRYEARDDRLADEAVTLARQAGDLIAEAVALRMQMMLVVNIHHDYASAEPHVQRAQALWEQLGDHRNARRRLLDRATCWAWCGRNAEAAAALASCEAEARVDGDSQTGSMSAWQLGRVLVRLRRWAEAAAAFRRCLQAGWQRNNLLTQSYALLHLPDALVLSGQAETAARLQGFAAPHWERQFGPINSIEAAELRRTRRLLRLALGAPHAEALRLSGRGLSLAEAVALALGSG